MDTNTKKPRPWMTSDTTPIPQDAAGRKAWQELWEHEIHNEHKLRTDWLLRNSTPEARELVRESIVKELAYYRSFVGTAGGFVIDFFTVIESMLDTYRAEGVTERDPANGLRELYRLLDDYRGKMSLPAPEAPVDRASSPTGRLSVPTDPPLQNLPPRTDIGQDIARAFSAENRVDIR